MCSFQLFASGSRQSTANFFCITRVFFEKNFFKKSSLQSTITNKGLNTSDHRRKSSDSVELYLSLINEMAQFIIKPILALLIASATCASVSAQQSSRWYERHAEGWHWYKDPIKVEEEEQLLEEPPLPEKPKLEQPAPKQFVPKPEEPPKPVAFSSEWLNVMIPKYLSKAVDDPTPENVEAFYLLQRLALDKAERFQKVAEQVQVGNKFIDETERRPISSYGLQTVDREAQARREALLNKISESAGIFFFFKEDCPFCEKQAPILKHIQERNGFDVLAIGVGGGTLKTTTFENTVVDSGQAKMLSVETTPSIFLVHPSTTTFALIGSSLLTVPEIQERIILIAQRNKWITEEEVNAARPRILNESGVDLSKELPKMLKAVQEDPNKIDDLMAVLNGRDPVGERERLMKLTDEKKRSLMDSDGFIEPKDILKIIKAPYQSQQNDTIDRIEDSYPLQFPMSFESR